MGDLVQKKMVYLYLVNYAESNSELAILAVNTLQKDCRDDDPMIRGLALRSLCSLNLLSMVEYLAPEIKKGLEDVNGYVRKTAAIGCVKLFHLSRQVVMDTDLVPALKRLVNDSDAHVVANTLYALEEVLVDEGGLVPTREMTTTLLNRIQQFSEWGQCGVLQTLSKYRVQDQSEMFDIMNICDSLLKQSSSAVVLAVTKIFIDLTSNRPELQIEVLRRLRAPLLTLMATATPELAYTVLVHVQALCSRGVDNADVFAAEYKQFFCRYNEPSYIKTVKIDILTQLADAASSEAIVAELSEYVTDVDAEISRRAIRAIGKIAVRLPPTAEMIVTSLTSLLELDIDYVSTESAIVMKDLVRKYPQQFQRASGAVERCMKIVTEAEGKCALLWILGEYGVQIEDAPYLLEPMIDGFLEEISGAVRLEMLTAAVKLFFCRPPEMQPMLGRLMQKAICETTHPDVRDRALLYYRLLEHSPEEARRVICAPKEVVEEFQEEVDAEMRDRIFEEFNTLSTVYKQPAAKFVLSKNPTAMGATKMAPPPLVEAELAQLQYNKEQAEPHSFDDPTIDEVPQEVQPEVVNTDLSTDLLGESLSLPVTASVPQSASHDLLGGDLDFMGGDFGGNVDAPAVSTAAVALLPGAVLDGGVFQARWASLPGQHVQQRQVRPGVQLTTETVEAALRQSCIYVIASGALSSTSFKFYFFARQATEVWFLLELVMTSGGWGTTGSAQCTVKTDNGQASVDGFFDVLWGALDALVS